jgi:hypothetical protein
MTMEGKTFVLVEVNEAAQYDRLRSTAMDVVGHYFLVIQRGSRTPETLRRMKALIDLHRDQLESAERLVDRLLEEIHELSTG